MSFVYKKRSSAQVEAKLRELKTGSGYQPFKSEFTVWKPKDGDNIIRILPPTWENADHYGLILGIHFFIGPEKSSFICPYKFDRKPCPLCEKKERLEKMGNKKESDSYRATSRTLVWIIDRNEEAKGPQLWGMPLSKVDAKILETSQNKRTGERYPVDDPEEGYDIFVTKTGQMLTTEYTIQIDRQSSPVDAKWVNFVVKNPLPFVLVHHDADVIRIEMDGISPEEAVDTATPPSAKHQMLDNDEDVIFGKEEKKTETTGRKTRPTGNRLASLKELTPRKLFRLADTYNIELPAELEDEHIPDFLDTHLPNDADLSLA